jgi:NAD(P)-dependent dehydrogenase (short-subunit alcohol dehydrogenase family)
MDRKVCLITGANAGIGKAASILIAKKDYEVIIGCRNKERAEKALNEIKKESGSDNIKLLLIDMSSQESIKNGARIISDQYNKIDVIIHNAADFDLGRKEPIYSNESIETIWATNHIGPVLLNNLIMEKLKNSDQGRILTVASKGLLMYPFLKINIEDPEFRKKSFSVEKSYYHSKLAQVMYTYWLSKELMETKITVNCIRVTNVQIDINRYPNISEKMKKMYEIKRKFSITPEEMAKTYEYLATSDEVSKISGKIFDEKNRIVNTNTFSKRMDNIISLMELTKRFIR